MQIGLAELVIVRLPAVYWQGLVSLVGKVQPQINMSRTAEDVSGLSEISVFSLDAMNNYMNWFRQRERIKQTAPFSPTTLQVLSGPPFSFTFLMFSRTCRQYRGRTIKT